MRPGERVCPSGNNLTRLGRPQIGSRRLAAAEFAVFAVFVGSPAVSAGIYAAGSATLGFVSFSVAAAAVAGSSESLFVSVGPRALYFSSAATFAGN